jgi:hypothetical protein
MADCNTEFTQFLEKIQLSKSKVDNLRTSRDAIRGKIENYYKDKKVNIPKFVGQGSFKVKTGIFQSGEDYDIDHGVYLQHLPEKKVDWPKTETVRDGIKEALKNHTESPLEDKTSCIRVQYKKEYHVDLSIYGEFEGKTYLARKGNEQWVVNDPRLFTNWVLQKIKANGEQLRSVIKYIKKWAYFNGWIDNISGFFITILVGNHFMPVAERDDSALYHTLLNLTNYLKNNRKIIRPVEPIQNLTGSFTEAEMDKMITRFEDFRDKAKDAVFGLKKKELVHCNI